MKRRHFAISCLVATVPCAIHAQAPRVRRIGIVVPTPGNSGRYTALRDGLRKLGWIEGQNLVIDWRFAEAAYDRITPMAQELIASGAELILTNSTPSVINVRRASSTVPIVAAAFSDPVARGLAESLSRPGGNVTGISILFDGIVDKVFELALTLRSKTARMAVLHNPLNPSTVSDARRVSTLATQQGVPVQVLGASVQEELSAALATVSRGGAGTMLVLADPFLFGQRRQIAEFALAQQVAAYAQSAEFVEAGFLASYGPDFLACFASAASFVDRILKGSKPADMPIEQVTKLELGINLKTASSLGLRIPQTVLLRADRVVE